MTRRACLLVSFPLVVVGVVAGVAAGACGGAEPSSANQPPIGGSEDVGEVDDGDDDADDGDERGEDGLGEETPGCPTDGYEPNDAAAEASALTWSEVVEDGGRRSAQLVADGRLCASEHDWYTISVAELGFAQHRLALDALVAGASWCGHLDGCEGEALSVGPEHTLAVELYDAASMVQLASAVATNGRVDLDVSGPEFGKDLVVHVYSPTRAADFGYALHVAVRDHEVDPDCAC